MSVKYVSFEIIMHVSLCSYKIYPKTVNFIVEVGTINLSVVCRQTLNKSNVTRTVCMRKKGIDFL
jgi:hypothetical protein